LEKGFNSQETEVKGITELTEEAYLMFNATVKVRKKLPSDKDKP